MALEITDGNFSETVTTNKGVALVDFWAEWCGPCRLIGPVVEELAKEYEGKGTKARYVRGYSNGSHLSKLNCWQEIEVYALPAK